MFFSVIVPVYNVEKYLNECIDSILSQTFTDFELILVDDGSKDNSGVICDEYAQKDDRVKVIHKENGGQSSARNCGVDCAQGKYAIFLDSDDFFASNAFFAELKDAIKDETDVAVFRYYKYFNENKKEECGGKLADMAFENKGELFAQLVKRDAFFCSCWSKCTSLQLLKKSGIRFDENLRCEDMDWYYSVIEKAQNFTVIDKAYVCYRQRENSVTSTLNEKSVVDNIITINKWKDIFMAKQDGVEKDALLASLAKLYCNLLIAYSRNKQALKHLKKDIFQFKALLRYAWNPRTKVIYRFSKIFGLHFTCFVLQILNNKKAS